MIRSATWLLATLGLLVCGCPGRDDDPPPADDDDAPYDGPRVGLLGDDPTAPYPSIHLVDVDPDTATGYRLALPDGALPTPIGGSSLDLPRLNRRDGFSPANPAIVLLPEVDLDPATLPPWTDPARSVDADAAVQLFDLDAGTRIPCFAELDAHPQVTGPSDRTLLIRPLQALPVGGRVAVVLTDALLDRDGASIPTPARFAALRDGGELPPGLVPYADHYAALLDQLDGLGVPRARIVLAWDFPVASEATLHADLDHVLAATRAALPVDAAFEPSYVVEWVADVDQGHELAPQSWRLAQGTFALPSFLDGDGDFTFGDDGLPTPQGDDDVEFLAMVPSSLREAPAGSAPVLVFGHGIFSSPYSYLGHDDDPSSLLTLADRLGMIVIGVQWRGLCTDDLIDGIQVANDFGRFSLITDKLVQGVANADALPRLVRTRFADASMFEATGGGSLIDPERVYYHGISLGGIEGAVLLANSDTLDHGVLHVGGAMWSTMLERSSNWTAFEGYLADSVPSPPDRQLLYAVSQLLWDPVDPFSHVDDLRGRSLLWQESLGDEQVPNLTLEALIRSVDVPVLEPSVEPPWGVDGLDAPLGPDAAALMQFDPQLGRPTEANRPAEVTGAHYYIRHTDEAHAQIEAFFTAGAEGTIIHPCGGQPCVFEPAAEEDR